MAKSTRRARDEDDEEEERPARRNRRDDDDDEEEEEPAARKRPRRDDDDESEELPAGTPTVYVHEECKGKTVMPSEVILEYLENPFDLGEEPTTTCKRCKEDVPWQDCYWAETKQNLYVYIDDLRGEMFTSGNDPRPGSPGFNWLLLIFGAILGAAAGGGVGAKAGNLAILIAVGVLLGILAGVLWMFIDRAKNVKASAEWNRKLVSRYYKRHPEAKQKSKKRAR